MDIEIAEPGRMTQSGSSLLKLIQNNNMPILDLLVRESIQNSLDAKNEKDSYVTVEFKTALFDKEKLNLELNGVTETLNKRYKEKECSYIAICDTNTTGLTGKLHYDDVKDNQYGNLLKLIYEISRPQEAEGAGGSWGLGKTVYFRIGIGLVLYYSRIRNEEGNFESRLAASLVEDEMKKDSIIPSLNGKSKRGIAWWGKSIGNNKTCPITDENYINQILSIFNIMPYKEEVTGTIIIIPYINSKELLNNNMLEFNDGESPFWNNDLEKYLKIAIQRWYAPRLNNINYPYGKYLRVKVNNVGISLDEMEPTFKIIQALYNRAVYKRDDFNDILKNSNSITKYDKVSLRKFVNKSEVGTVAYTKVKKDVLKMNYPDNKPSPYSFFNLDIINKENNKPIIAFTRRPGMIVSYENVGKWVDGIDASDKDNFIIGIFVLNSENKLDGISKEISLEEYVRKSEMADHTSWNDFSIENVNPRIISKIQTQVNNKINKEFTNEKEDGSSKLNSGLGKLMGDLLLPPENFGKNPSVGTSRGSTSKSIQKHKDVMLTLNEDNTIYSAQEIIFDINIKAKGKINRTGVTFGINSESGIIFISEWEEKMGLNMPFYIKSASLKFLTVDGNECNLEEYYLDCNKANVKNCNFKCELLKSNSGKGYSIVCYSKDKHTLEVQMKIKLHFDKRDVKSVFLLEKDEGEK